MPAYCRAELTLLAVRSLPAGQADFVALLAARVMAELVVSRATEGGARRIVIVRGTLNTNPGREQKHLCHSD